jgi:hypothetical protein
MSARVTAPLASPDRAREHRPQGVSAERTPDVNRATVVADSPFTPLCVSAADPFVHL